MRCPVFPIKAAKVSINQSCRAVILSCHEMSWRHTDHVLPQEMNRIYTVFLVLWYKLGRYTAFSPTPESPSTLKSWKNKVKVLAGEIIGATWFVYMLIIQSWCKSRQMYTRDPSADRHKNTRTLYKATASSTRHFTAKAGQVSQLLLLWAAHTSVLAYTTWNCNGYQEHCFLLPLKIN